MRTVHLPGDGIREKPTAPAYTLCAECKVLADDWWNFPLPSRVKIASGAAYDDTKAGVADNRRAHFDDWRQTIRFQVALIGRICRERHPVEVAASA